MHLHSNVVQLLYSHIYSEARQGTPQQLEDYSDLVLIMQTCYFLIHYKS